MLIRILVFASILGCCGIPTPAFLENPDGPIAGTPEAVSPTPEATALEVASGAEQPFILAYLKKGDVGCELVREAFPPGGSVTVLKSLPWSECPASWSGAMGGGALVLQGSKLPSLLITSSIVALPEPSMELLRLDEKGQLFGCTYESVSVPAGATELVVDGKKLKVEQESFISEHGLARRYSYTGGRWVEQEAEVLGLVEGVAPPFCGMMDFFSKLQEPLVLDPWDSVGGFGQFFPFPTDAASLPPPPGDSSWVEPFPGLVMAAQALEGMTLRLPIYARTGSGFLQLQNGAETVSVHDIGDSVLVTSGGSVLYRKSDGVKLWEGGAAVLWESDWVLPAADAPPLVVGASNATPVPIAEPVVTPVATPTPAPTPVIEEKPDPRKPDRKPPRNRNRPN